MKDSTSARMIAAAIILSLVESYIVLSAGVLLMGFGGSRWTKDFALKTVIYAVSVGAKLFVLQLIAGLGAQIIGGWASLPEGQSVLAPVNATSNILVIVGSTLVLSVLVKTVPEMIQGADQRHRHQHQYRLGRRHCPAGRQRLCARHGGRQRP